MRMTTFSFQRTRLIFSHFVAKSFGEEIDKPTKPSSLALIQVVPNINGNFQFCVLKNRLVASSQLT